MVERCVDIAEVHRFDPCCAHHLASVGPARAPRRVCHLRRQRPPRVERRAGRSLVEKDCPTQFHAHVAHSPAGRCAQRNHCLSTLCTGSDRAGRELCTGAPGPGRSRGVDNARDDGHTLRPVTGRIGDGEGEAHRSARRVCSRQGCNSPVKKPTAKYCSVRCCTIDPERRLRLRISSQRSTRSVLPMSRQLSLTLSATNNPEAALLGLGEGREDIPRGMSRLCS